jgi:hypothetical protein
LDNLNANELVIFGLLPVNLNALSQMKGEVELEQPFVLDCVISKYNFIRQLLKNDNTNFSLDYSNTREISFRRLSSNPLKQNLVPFF